MTPLVCPDCGRGFIEIGGRCTNCSLSFEELDDSAAFLDNLHAETLEAVLEEEKG